MGKNSGHPSILGRAYPFDVIDLILISQHVADQECGTFFAPSWIPLCPTVAICCRRHVILDTLFAGFSPLAGQYCRQARRYSVASGSGTIPTTFHTCLLSLRYE